MPDIQYPENSNSDTAFVVQEGGQKNRVLMTVEDNDGTVEYSNSPNSTSAYVTIDGKKHRALLTAPQDTSTLEMSDNPNSTKGYVTVDGKKHRVVLTANIAGGGGTPINNQDISVTANGEYTAEEGYTGLGTVTVNVPNPSTGTKSITANGVYDVTAFASADVQVPTTAPDCYRAFQTNASGQLVNSTSTPFTGLPAGTTDIAAYCFANAYKDTPSSVLSGSIDLSSLTTITGSNACSYMFQSCTGITSVDLSSLTTITGSDACRYMFGVCTGITSVDLSSLTTISSNGCSYMFSGCTGITSVDLSSLTTITGSNACSYMFQSCTGITSVDLSSLTTITQANATQYMFQSCTGLTNVDLSSLTSITGNWPCGSMFSSCSSLNSVSLPSLSSIKNSNHAIEKFFHNCTSLSTVYFPCLHAGSFGTQTNQWDNMLQGVTGCTVHFPSNLQSVISSWTNVVNGFGGTNTTVLYDLPATNTLTGADSKTYSRNPKYDTATALAWKVGAYDTTNFTPAYYTSGTTDPQVGDTIYSDSACTTAVTTISSIA